jgi:hypothetical protein
VALDGVFTKADYDGLGGGEKVVSAKSGMRWAAVARWNKSWPRLMRLEWVHAGRKIGGSTLTCWRDCDRWPPPPSRRLGLNPKTEFGRERTQRTQSQTDE